MATLSRPPPPVPARCAYCQVPYDFVGRTETAEEDTEFVFRSAGMHRFDRRVPTNTHAAHTEPADTWGD